MWLILLCLLQNPGFEVHPINARLTMPSGKVVEMVDVRIKGIEPYTFEFQTNEGTSLVSLLEVARIARIEDSHQFEITFLTGQRQRGRIKSLGFTAERIIGEDINRTIYLFHIDRIQLVSGAQIRSCAEGHYEEYTPYLFCPVCGRELELGPEFDEEVEPGRSLGSEHRLRLDPRDPVNPASGRRN